MKSYSSQKALRTVVENFRKPRQLFMYHPIKFEIDGTFPSTKTTLYSKNVNGTTYWLANMQNDYEERDRQILTHDGKFRESDFLKVFDEFCKSTGLFAGANTPSTCAEKCYTQAIEKYMEKNNIAAQVQNKSSHFFAMNESQMFKYRHYENHTFPEGYSIDAPDVSEDVDIIIKASSAPSNANLVKEKLRRFPSLCVKKGSELAGFISSESHGALANLHVFDGHRGKNLGERLEIGAAKMAMKNGIRPCKFIDTNNSFFLEKAKKSKLMDLVESKGTPIVFDQNIYSPVLNYALHH
uniref:Glycine N-acyltransferase-like protein n=1 Tax=Caenorhabditis japonica TaxID=281687 RepID=A0A8R1DXZ1_CAEJA